jgi:phospholipid/cholesterol/gamma-HCH transport system substrate-binding protein
MSRNAIETVMGGVVLVVAAVFLVFAYNTTNTGGGAGGGTGYTLTAQFNQVVGLDPGSEVMISGVRVGRVVGASLNSETYLAEVTIGIETGVELPRDTIASVESTSLLGGKYLNLIPGGESAMLEPGERIQYTQSVPSLEQLLGQVVHSVSSGDG